jgi:hypothetical protein
VVDLIPVTHLLWHAAGEPSGSGDAHGTCRVCGLESTGLPFADWVRPTFTDWDKLRPGDILCRACQFSFKEHSELLAARADKEKPQRMRNYSHFVVGGEWLPLSKAQKAEMALILLKKSPQVAAVAVSGQKHIVFRAQPGWWQVEEQSMLPDPAALEWLLERVEKLYVGFSKAEIGIGDYAQHRALKFGVGRWGAYEETLKPLRGTALFNLALFLAQKKNGAGYGGNQGTEQIAHAGGGAAGRGLAGDPRQLQIPL